MRRPTVRSSPATIAARRPSFWIRTIALANEGFTTRQLTSRSGPPRRPRGPAGRSRARTGRGPGTSGPGTINGAQERAPGGLDGGPAHEDGRQRGVLFVVDDRLAEQEHRLVDRGTGLIEPLPDLSDQRGPYRGCAPVLRALDHVSSDPMPRSAFARGDPGTSPDLSAHRRRGEPSRCIEPTSDVPVYEAVRRGPAARPYLRRIFGGSGPSSRSFGRFGGPGTERGVPFGDQGVPPRFVYFLVEPVTRA